MSGDVWWERDARERERADGRIVPGPGPTGGGPELVDATREAVRAEVRGRIAGYTPDWTDPDRQDAGVAAGTNTALRQLGSVFGVAIMSVVFARYGGYGSPTAFLHGFRPAMGVAPQACS